MLDIKKDRRVKRAEELLKEHRSEMIEELGASAFDLLSPGQVQAYLGAAPGDLTRQGWLEPAPKEKDIGPAHLYYRWRVEFVKQFRRSYGDGSKKT